MNQNSIGRAVKEARLAQGMTQAALGSRLGYSAMTISHFETGVREVRPDDFRLISNVLDLDLSSHGETASSTVLFRASGVRRGGAGIIERSLQAFDRHIQKKYGNNEGTETAY